LRERLKAGELDVIIVAQPFHEQGVMTWDVYEEPFRIVLPADHRWAERASIPSRELEDENLLLLGEGHCFREQVIDACPECVSGETGGEPLRNTVEGSSLETIRQMVASGLGVTVLPATSLAFSPYGAQKSLLVNIPFDGKTPSRTITLAWRRSLPRFEAIEALHQSIQQCRLAGVEYVNASPG
jgi:LysR family hydrogen peroxide-inducible transcriptional activator